jgi:hypothetical protein
VKALRDPGVFHGEPRAGRQWRALESPHSSRSPETSRWWWGRVGYRLLAPSGVAGLGNKRKVAVFRPCLVLKKFYKIFQNIES